MRFIFKDILSFVHIPFVSKVKFQFLTQFSVDYLSFIPRMLVGYIHLQCDLLFHLYVICS